MGVLGTSWSCECGSVHEVPTRLAVIETGAIERLGEVFESLNLSGPVLVVSDETTREVAGRRVEGVLSDSGLSPRSFVLPGKKPRADEETAMLAAAAVETRDAAIVSVGSGTITDLSKYAAFESGLPHVAVATAPSMNGYASGIVALTVGGLKTTNPVKPPVAVVGDLEILSRAPAAMIRAGLGDLISKPVAGADWKLSSIIRGEHFCMRPLELVRSLEPLYMVGADSIARGELRAISALMEALVLSGVSMVIAGSSAPASGGEHLISHFVDMRADLEGRTHDLHGAQVGVATLATSRLYERMMKLSSGAISDRALSTAWKRGEELAARVRSIFGARAGAILPEFERKRGEREAFEEEAKRLASRWDEVRDALRGLLMPSSQIRAALDLAGAPVHYSGVGLDAGGFRDALMCALCIRGRYTILDAALAFGELEEWADEIVGA